MLKLQNNADERVKLTACVILAHEYSWMWRGHTIDPIEERLLYNIWSADNSHMMRNADGDRHLEFLVKRNAAI